MVVSVIKSDGNIEEFNLSKLKKSIENAALDAGYDEDRVFQIVEDISQYVLESLANLERADTQSLRNLILAKLDLDYPDIAKTWRDYDSQVKNK